MTQKKRFLLLITAAILLAASVFSGCESSLGRAIREREAANQVPDLSPSELFTEEGGFHYREISWGTDSEKILKTYTGYSLNNVATYGEDGTILYTADYIKTAISGRRNDTATVTVNSGDVVAVVSLAFSADSEVRKEGDPSEQQIFESYLEELKAQFGEPDKEDKSDRVVNDISTTYHVYFWDYTTADGTETQLQWSAAYISGEKEPTYVTLGTVWLNAPVKEAEEK